MCVLFRWTCIVGRCARSVRSNRLSLETNLQSDDERRTLLYLRRHSRTHSKDERPPTPACLSRSASSPQRLPDGSAERSRSEATIYRHQNVYRDTSIPQHSRPTSQWNKRCLCSVFTARCTLVQSAVLRSHVVCPSVCRSVCDVGEL